MKFKNELYAWLKTQQHYVDNMSRNNNDSYVHSDWYDGKSHLIDEIFRYFYKEQE